MANRYSTQFIGTLEKKMVMYGCNFTVSATDTAGYGQTGLVGAGVAAVYMHTSATPATGNPNPANGIIIVKFQDNFPLYLGGSSFISSPPSGTDVVVTASGAALTVGVPYQITALGTTTAANWITLGVPVGITPAVGVTFVAAATGAGTGTGKVQTLQQSAVGKLEILGDPALTMTSKGAAVLGGTSPAGNYMLFQNISDQAVAFTGNTQSSTTIASVSSYEGLRVGQAISGTGIPLGTTITVLTPGSSTLTLSAAATASATAVPLTASPGLVRAAPVNGSRIFMNFMFSNSYVTVKGA